MDREVVYFSAADDREAAAAERRAGGPLGSPTVVGQRYVGFFRREPIIATLGPAYDGFAVRGYEPEAVEILGAILRRAPFSEVESDPRFSGSVRDDEPRPPTYDGGDEPVVVSMTPGLQTALAHTDPDDLAGAVARWIQTTEFDVIEREDVTAGEHLDFVTRLRDLAVHAERTGQRLYCCLDA